MYSLVFAADMYATVFKKDPLDPELGQKYRKEILLPGGSRDELDSLKVCTVSASEVALLTFILTEFPGSSTECRCFHERAVRIVLIYLRRASVSGCDHGRHAFAQLF